MGDEERSRRAEGLVVRTPASQGQQLIPAMASRNETSGRRRRSASGRRASSAAAPRDRGRSSAHTAIATHHGEDRPAAGRRGGGASRYMDVTVGGGSGDRVVTLGDDPAGHPCRDTQPSVSVTTGRCPPPKIVVISHQPERTHHDHHHPTTTSRRPHRPIGTVGWRRRAVVAAAATPTAPTTGPRSRRAWAVLIAVAAGSCSGRRPPGAAQGERRRHRARAVDPGGRCSLLPGVLVRPAAGARRGRHHRRQRRPERSVGRRQVHRRRGPRLRWRCSATSRSTRWSSRRSQEARAS